MSVNSEYLDAIFNGTGAVVTTAQNVCNAFANGVNDVKNIMDNSRRNQPSMSGMANEGYPRVVTYPYAYSDNGSRNAYGNSLYPTNGYNGLPMNGNDPDYYPGISNPRYGYLGTAPTQGMFGNNNNGPDGSAWL